MTAVRAKITPTLRPSRKEEASWEIKFAKRSQFAAPAAGWVAWASYRIECAREADHDRRHPLFTREGRQPPALSFPWLREHGEARAAPRARAARAHALRGD